MTRTLLLLALLLPTALPASAQPAPPLRVGRVTIETVDVYSNAEARKGFIYRMADRLHLETKASVIRKFLLFREGEEFRPERLAETERNLRKLPFLKAASVTASEPRDGVVDVVVVTQDAWSIAPETQAGSKGGETTYGLNISETNLFGLGKEVSIDWDKTIDRTRLGIAYQDPMLFDGYWNTHFTYGTTSDGYDRRLNVRRPFYSFATPWATEMTYEGYRQEDRLFTDSRESSRFRHDHERILATYGIAMSPEDQRANRVSAGLEFLRDDFATIETQRDVLLPANRDHRFVFARFEHVENRFLKLNFINKDLRYEDFNVGRQFMVEGGVSPKFLGTDSTAARVRVSGAEGWQLTPTAFFLPTVALESRFDSGPEHTIASAKVLYVHRQGRRHPTTTLARLVVNSGWRVDRDVQFFADGLTGLRGYRAYAFSGTRSIVINLEQRLYLGRELLQLASPGIVAFVDAGNATTGGLRSLMKLKTDVGIGLRMGLPRTPRNLLRLDLAYALNADPRGRRGLLVSVSSGQAF